MRKLNQEDMNKREELHKNNNKNHNSIIKIDSSNTLAQKEFSSPLQT